MTNIVEQEEVVKTIHCRSAKEFIQQLTLTDKEWHWAGRRGKRTSWIFRGQSDVDWSLRPSAWRFDKESLFTQFIESAYFGRNSYGLRSKFEYGFDDTNIAHRLTDVERERIVDLGVLLRAESIMVNQFLDKADRAAHVFPSIESGDIPVLIPRNITRTLSEFYFVVKRHQESDSDLSTVYEGIVEALARDGCVPNLNRLSLTALVQHHGIPTQLLDWTLNPFVAAYFAAESDKDTFGRTIAVWALNQKHFIDKRSQGGSLIQFYSTLRHEIGYLRHQHGLFTFIPSPTLWSASFHPIHQYIAEGVLPSYEVFLGSLPHSDFDRIFLGKIPIRKITLSARYSKDVLELLDNFNISLSTLKPTLDNVTVELKRHIWQLRKVYEIPVESKNSGDSD